MPDHPPEPLSDEEIEFPTCIHRWDAPETCPMCLCIYKQRVIEARDATIDADREGIAELTEEIRRLKHE